MFFSLLAGDHAFCNWAINENQRDCSARSHDIKHTNYFNFVSKRKKNYFNFRCVQIKCQRNIKQPTI